MADDKPLPHAGQAGKCARTGKPTADQPTIEVTVGDKKHKVLLSYLLEASREQLDSE